MASVRTLRPRLREAGWLGRSLTLLLALAFVALLVALAVGWSLETVGALYQVLGIAIAGMGVPIVAPRLQRAEQALNGWARGVGAWMRTRRDAVREWWRRLRRRGGKTLATSVRASADIATMVERASVAKYETEVAALKHEVESLKEAHAEDRADFARQLAAQREELRAHTVSVTQGGWQYILSGAACSAFGTVLPLFG